VQHWQLIN